ncbi:MAG: PilZ domain-containing protein [Nitrospirae bacterium]|nr:PilZ domain-containing protein [Nitrospirota bacterium]
MKEATIDTTDKNNLYVLVVDFNVDDRFFTCMLLQRYGYNICTAGSGSEAISFMHVAPPAIIVAESSIGIGLASRLKKDVRFSNIPIIVLAKASDLDLDLRVRRGEFTACLNKPLDAETFYQAVQTALGKTPRKKIRIEASLLARLDGVEEGIVSILSEYGMFFPTEEPRQLNTVVMVELELGDKTVKLEAVVLYSFELETSPFKEAGMGMKFVKITPEDQALIRSYVLEQSK